jgi:hypothetical protein
VDSDAVLFSLLLFLVISNVGFSEIESEYDLFIGLTPEYGLEGEDNGSFTASKKSSRSSRRLRIEM